MSVIRFSFGEAALSLWRRRRSTLLALVTTAVAVFVLGGFLLINANLQRWVGEWTASAELSVYVSDDVTPDERTDVQQALAGSPIVAAADFVDQQEALERFRRLFPDLAETAEQLGDRPLPASFEVRLKPDVATDEAVALLTAGLREMPGVEDVRYDRAWIDRVVTFVDAARVAGLALAAVLVLAATLTVATVVRLALHTRQQEVEIMYLVGAPLGFIRGPFVVEGVLQGGLGALVAALSLYALFLVLRGSAGEALAGLAGGGPPLVFLTWTVVLGLLAGGMLVGCLGGYLAARSAR